MSIFPPFTPVPGTYPDPIPQVLLPFPSYPTNSWIENALNPKIPDANRNTNAVPWYWTPSYNSNSMYLSYTGSTASFSNTTTNGNLIIQESPGFDITIGTFNPTGLTLRNIDEFTAQYLQTSASGFVEAIPTRGSPFATCKYANTPVRVNFKAFTVTNFTSVPAGGTTCYIVDTNRVPVDVLNVSMRPDTSNPSESKYVTDVCSFYTGSNDTGLKIETQYNNNNNNIFDAKITIPNNITIDFHLTLGAINIPPPSPSPYVTSITINNTVLNNYQPSITINTADNQIFTVSANLQPGATPFIVTSLHQYPQNTRWYIYTDAILTQSGNIISSNANYTGLVQIACGGNDVTKHNSFQNLFSTYAGGYVEQGIATNFSGEIDDLWKFDIAWTIGASPNGIIWLAPNHWNKMALTGMTKINSSAFIQHFMYGNLSWYEITNPITNVGIINQKIPIEPDISTFTPAQINALVNQLAIDIPFLIQYLPGASNPQSSTDPYGYGTSAAAFGRLLVLAKLCGVLNLYISEIQIYKNTLEAWLNGTNSAQIPSPNQNVYQLQHESVWGGLIVPADYLITQNSATIGSFGNSFYNDHHFHWGYLLYSLYTLELIGDGLSGTYPNQIKEIILDISNPVYDSYGWKTRHKDWYSGHSLATGLTNEINRQQESSGEAINGYYAAYLMARILGDPFVTNIAGACMWLELIASQQYYQMLAPGMRIGVMSKPGNVGIMQTLSKDFTLDWGMQPDSFNGRAIGIYGIQTLPYTEITFHLLNNKYWINILPNLQPWYALTPSLVKGLTGDQYTAVLPPNGNNDDPNFNPVTSGTFWGLVGLKILSYSNNAISKIDADTAYTNAVTKQLMFNNPPNKYPTVKQFDSFSNTLYVLTKLGKF